MGRQVLINLRNEVAVVCAVFVQPENCLGTGGAGPSNSQLYPIMNGDVFGLTHTPDVTGLHFMAQ